MPRSLGSLHPRCKTRDRSSQEGRCFWTTKARRKVQPPVSNSILTSSQPEANLSIAHLTLTLMGSAAQSRSSSKRKLSSVWLSLPFAPTLTSSVRVCSRNVLTFRWSRCWLLSQLSSLQRSQRYTSQKGLSPRWQESLVATYPT